MDMTEGPAAPASGIEDILDFAQLAADPEIAALLDFEPVPVRQKVNGWDADAQRAFIVLLATTGSKLRAARAIGRKVAGLDRLLKRPGAEADGLRRAHDAALALFRRSSGEKLASSVAAARKADPQAQAPGQLLNEYGEWEDEDSLRRRGEEAAESICAKLLRIRRYYLHEISSSAAKRAAFEILTELPIDWKKAEALEPQPDEPWRKTSQRDPDMVLLAESGWSMGEHGYGPDKKAEMRAAIDAYREEEGLEPVNWGEGE